MITTFELKNSPGCKQIYRLPYYMKNVILLFLLMCIMLPTYLLHNKSGDISYKTIEKMIAGLNSEIFDYLIAHSEHELKIGD